MVTFEKQLKEIAEQIRSGTEPTPTPTVRQLLSWFGAERRGYVIVNAIRIDLLRAGLRTDPDFNSVWLDATIRFELLREPETQGARASALASTQPAEAEDGSLAYGEDPTYRIGRLSAANTAPLSVAPDCPLEQVVTIMLLNRCDWLVVQSGGRDLRGVVSWRSLGRQLALKHPCTMASDCMEDATAVDQNRSLFEALPFIVANGYVLVQANSKIITGMVTTRDLSEQFRTLSEPFLLLGEIENQLRNIISNGQFTKVELEAARDPADTFRPVNGIADLTFGEYVRLVEGKDTWIRLGIAVDRATVVKQLEGVRQIRNDVMHFDPDPLGDEALGKLRQFAGFLRELADARSVSSRRANTP